METQDEVLQDLTLALMLLTSWQERQDDLRRCWKNYDFDILNELNDAGFISDSRRAKSAYLTEEGVERARAFLARLGLSADI